MSEPASAFDTLFPSPGELGDAIQTFEGLWPENVEHVSASSLKTLSACPEQFRRRYLLGEKQPPGAALVWGSADHKTSEFNYQQKIESGEDLPLVEIRDYFAAQVDVAVEEAGGLNEMEWKPDEKSRKRKTIDDVKDRGARLAEAYHLEVAPAVQPEAVEEKFSIEVPGVPVPIIGYLDLVAGPSEQQRAGRPEGASEGVLDLRRIVDRKTSGRKVSKPEPDWSMQAGIYQLARWLPHEWQISVKTQNPYVIAGDENLLVKASTARRRFVLRTIRALMLELGWMYVQFGADEPWPASRALLHQWRCSFCGYSDTCEWRKGAL
jgi:CRISPR/Cas system-associated exonuclease Cas4 (RecB family)